MERAIQNLESSDRFRFPIPTEDRRRSLFRQRVAIYGTLGVFLVASVVLLLVLRTQLSEDVRGLAHRAAQRHGLDPRLVEAVVRAESRGDPNAVSKAAAYGLMQLQTPTASDMAGRKVTKEELFDPEVNLDLGCRYLKRLFEFYGGDLRLTLMAYNAGPGNVRKWRKRTPDVEVILNEHAFGETRHYVKKVLGYYEDAE